MIFLLPCERPPFIVFRRSATDYTIYSNILDIMKQGDLYIVVDIGLIVKKECLKRQCSVRELSELAGTPWQTVYAWMNGSANPTIKHLEAFLGKLDLKLEIKESHHE